MGALFVVLMHIRGDVMANKIHLGSKISKAAKTLASKSSSKKSKSDAGKTLVNHKIKEH